MRLPVMLVAATAVAVLLAPAAPASAATTGPTAGIDVSYPNAALPPAPERLTVVGLTNGINDGTPVTVNPRLAPQLDWARSAHRVDVYVNTQHPDPAAAAWWPSGDTARDGTTVRPRYGTCTVSAPRSRTCAYVYGWSIANGDLTAIDLRGIVPGRWWLDVEGVRGGTGGEHGNDWSTSTLRNRAVLEGMTDRLRAAHRKVGLYSTRTQFHDIAGKPPTSSPLSTLPSWRAGAADEAAARRLCTAAPLTRGRLQVTQYISGGFDRDVVCATFASAPAPRITGSRTVGHVATAKAGTWSASPRLAYRWTRDGKPIAHATHRTYRLSRADAGHRVRVEVTATRTGWSRSVRTSAAIRPHR